MELMWKSYDFHVIFTCFPYDLATAACGPQRASTHISRLYPYVSPPDGSDPRCAREPRHLTLSVLFPLASTLSGPKSLRIHKDFGPKKVPKRAFGSVCAPFVGMAVPWVFMGFRGYQ